MKLNVLHLEKYYQKDYVFLKDLGTLVIGQEKIRFTKPVELSVKAELSGKGVLVSGNIRAFAIFNCNRCLEEYTDEISIDFIEKFFKEEIDVEKNEESYHYKGNVIVFDEFVSQNIILSLPVKRICSESCKGLCSCCGSNQNKSNCSCKEEPVDIRLTKLKDYFK